MKKNVMEKRRCLPKFDACVFIYIYIYKYIVACALLLRDEKRRKISKEKERVRWTKSRATSLDFYRRYLLATPDALGSLWVCFMCSMRASPPRKSLWQTGQLVALGPPIRAACCWNTTRCCNSFFGGPEQEEPEAGTPVESSRPTEYHHRVANQKRRTGSAQNRTIDQ